jgi:hypothetical protein
LCATVEAPKFAAAVINQISLDMLSLSKPSFKTLLGARNDRGTLLD